MTKTEPDYYHVSSAPSLSRPFSPGSRDDRKTRRRRVLVRRRRSKDLGVGPGPYSRRGGGPTTTGVGLERRTDLSLGVKNKGRPRKDHKESTKWLFGETSCRDKKFRSTWIHENSILK